jgi:hypothetical protein
MAARPSRAAAATTWRKNAEGGFSATGGEKRRVVRHKYLYGPGGHINTVADNELLAAFVAIGEADGDIIAANNSRRRQVLGRIICGPANIVRWGRILCGQESWRCVLDPSTCLTPGVKQVRDQEHGQSSNWRCVSPPPIEDWPRGFLGGGCIIPPAAKLRQRSCGGIMMPPPWKPRLLETFPPHCGGMNAATVGGKLSPEGENMCFRAATAALKTSFQPSGDSVLALNLAVIRQI